MTIEEKTKRAANDIAVGIMTLLKWANESNANEHLSEGAHILENGVRGALELLLMDSGHR